MAKRVLGAGSDFYDENLKRCQPCSVQKKSVSANTFCLDCNVYLCTTCSAHHKALLITKNHTQVSADKTQKAPPSVVKDKCNKKCSVHQDKAVKYYCTNHSHIGCSVCFTVEHRLCKDVEHIQTAAADIKTHTGFKKFDEDLKALGTAYKTCIADVKKSLQHVKEDNQQLANSFTDFKREVIDALDKMEKEISAQAKKIKDEETIKLDHFFKQLDKSLTDVDAMLQNVDLLLTNGKNCDVYVMTKTGVTQLKSLQEELAKTTVGKTYQRYDVQLDKDVLKSGAMGKLNTRVEPVSSGAAGISWGKPMDGPAMAKLMKPGVRVRRGKDWNRGCQDGGPGGLGTVENSTGRLLKGWYCVRWDTGNNYTYNYRMGVGNAYDLELV